MANFLESLGRGLAGAAAGQRDPAGMLQQQRRLAQQREMVTLATYQMILENTSPNNPVRAKVIEKIDAIRPGMGQMMGQGISKAPEAFNLAPGTVRFQNQPGGALPKEIARGLPRATSTAGTAGSRNRAEKIADLLRLNPDLTERQAVDVVDKNKVLSAPDKYGNLHLVSRTTGTSEVVAGPGSSTPAQATTAAGAQPTPKPDIEAAAGAGTGPISNIQQGLSNLFGFAFSGQIAPKNTEARQTLRFFERDAVRALILNRRFPVAEMKTVQNMLPDPDVFFKDPDDAVNQVRTFRTWLEVQQQTKETEMGSAGLTSNRKAELADQLSGIRETLSMFPSSDVASGRFAKLSSQQLLGVDPAQLSRSEKRAYLNALKVMKNGR